MKITVRGEAVVRTERGRIITGEELRKWDGESDDSTFSDFFGDDSEKMLIAAGVKGGELVFVYNEKTQSLFASTTYDIERELTGAEEEALVDYTQGQWSDGIGEGFEQNEVGGAYLSAWFSGQKCEVVYSE